MIEHKDANDECACWVGNLHKEFGEKESGHQLGVVPNLFLGEGDHQWWQN